MMHVQGIKPYGSWKSPITSDLASSATQLMEVALDADQVYWIELHPEEAGRYTLMRRNPDGQITEIVAAPFSARTLVHEYGGGAFVVADATVYFSNFADQRVYRQDPGSNRAQLLPKGICGMPTE